MRINIRLFAKLRDITDADHLLRDIPIGSTTKVVWQLLVDEFPELTNYTAVISTAINEDYARMDVVLKEGDEVAFLPPVSGGSQ